MITREDMLAMIPFARPRSHIADNFALYAKPYHLHRFLARYELMKMVLDIPGAIIECGIKHGAGLLQWYHLSKLLEWRGRLRIVTGFDTFTGFPSVSEKDSEATKVGDEAALEESKQDILRSIMMHTTNEVVIGYSYDTGNVGPGDKQCGDHYPWPQVGFIAGDFMQTGEQFLKDNPHVLIALLFLDFDIYEPTKRAIELFVPRMPKGSVIVFDELNHAEWPGETAALLETLGVRNLALKRFPWEMSISYAVL